MTKAELIDRIARSRDLPPDVTKKCIGEILDLAFGELSTYFVRTRITRTQTPRFTMPGFGTFTKKKRASRRGVNPQTLEPMTIEGYETVDFKPGSELRSNLKGGKSKSKAKTKAKTKSKSAGSKKSKTRGSSKKRSTSRKSAPAKKNGKARSGLGGTRLRSRDELEYVDLDESELPDAPLQRARGRRRRGDVESTG